MRFSEIIWGKLRSRRFNSQPKAYFTAQKMKFSIKDFFSKCDQIRMTMRIWSHLLKKSLMENFVICAVLHCVGVYYRLKFSSQGKRILTFNRSKISNWKKSLKLPLHWKFRETWICYWFFWGFLREFLQLHLSLVQCTWTWLIFSFILYASKGSIFFRYSDSSPADFSSTNSSPMESSWRIVTGTDNSPTDKNTFRIYI